MELGGSGDDHIVAEGFYAGVTTGPLGAASMWGRSEGWSEAAEGGGPGDEGVEDDGLTRRRSDCRIIFFVNGIGPCFLRDGVLGTTHFSQQHGVVSQRPFDPEMVFPHGFLGEGDGPLKQGVSFFILFSGDIQDAQIIERARQT